MASERKRRALTALTPMLLHPPPIVQNPQLLYSMAGVTDVDLDSAGITSTAALTAISMNQSKEPSPHPQQGGCRITIQYLQELSDAEALWAFRYVTSSPSLKVEVQV